MAGVFCSVVFMDTFFKKRGLVWVSCHWVFKGVSDNEERVTEMTHVDGDEYSINEEGI
jgi:hypothetical protein